MNERETVQLRKLGHLAIAICTAGVLTLAAVPANADDVDQPGATQKIDLTPQQEAFAAGKLKDHGATDAQASALVDALEDGVPWQSDGGYEPVSVTTQQVDGFPYEIQHFADGSYIASGIAPAPTSGVQPMSISGCSSKGTSAGVAYGVNCMIKYETAKASAQFVASYSTWATGQDIYNYKSPWVNYDLTGNVSGGHFSTSTASGYKWVQYTWQASTSFSTTTHYLQLFADHTGVQTFANY